MTTPSQAEELRNTVPIRYLPYHPSGPRRLPFQNLQQLHVSDLMTIVCAVNRRQYEQRLPRQVVTDLTAIVTSNHLIRRFFRDAFWWLYLMHFGDIDLELLLDVAKQNVLLSSADAAMMSMEAIKKRTAAMAPKMPPQTSITTAQQKKQQQQTSSSASPRGGGDERGPSPPKERSRSVVSLTGGGSSTLGNNPNRVQRMFFQQRQLKSHEGHRAEEEKMIVIPPPVAPTSATNSPRGENVEAKEEDSEHDRYRHRMVSLQHDTMERLQVMRMAAEHKQRTAAARASGQNNNNNNASSVNTSTMSTSGGVSGRRASVATEAGTNHHQQQPATSAPAAVAAIPTPPTRLKSTQPKTTHGGVVIAPMPSHLAMRAGNRTTEQLVHVGSPSTGNAHHLAALVLKQGAEPSSHPTARGGPSSSTPTRLVSALPSSSPMARGGGGSPRLLTPTKPLSSPAPLRSEISSAMASPSPAHSMTSPRSKAERFVTTFRRQRMKSTCGHSDTDTDREGGDGADGPCEGGGANPSSTAGQSVAALSNKKGGAHRPSALLPSALAASSASHGTAPQRGLVKTPPKQLTFRIDGEGADDGGTVGGATASALALRSTSSTPPATPVGYSRGGGGTDVDGGMGMFSGWRNGRPSVVGIATPPQASMPTLGANTNNRDAFDGVGGVSSSGALLGEDYDDAALSGGGGRPYDDEDLLTAAMTLRSFKATAVEDTEDDEEADDSMGSGSPTAPAGTRRNQKHRDDSRVGNASKDSLIYLQDAVSSPLLLGGTRPSTAIRGVNMASLAEERRAAFVQAEHHKLFSRMAMQYGQLLIDLIHGTAVGSSGRIATRRASPSPTRRSRSTTPSGTPRKAPTPTRRDCGLMGGSGGSSPATTPTRKSRDGGRDADSPHSIRRESEALSPALRREAQATIKAKTNAHNAPLLGRFESTVHRDVLVGYLPDLLAQGLFMAFALALPFANGTLLDADFQLSILRHVTFWIHGVESTQRFIVGATMQISQQQSPPPTAMTSSATNGALPKSTAGKSRNTNINVSTSASAGPPAVAVLTTVTLPAVGSIAANQRHLANPTLAAQDARTFKASASVTSWPVNAVMTVISRRRKEFWQLVKDGKAHPVTDFPLTTLGTLRLVLRSAHITGGGILVRDTPKKKAMAETPQQPQPHATGGGGGGSTPPSAALPSFAAPTPPTTITAQSPRKRVSLGDTLGGGGPPSLTSPPSRANSASRRRGGANNAANAHALNQQQQPTYSTRGEIVDRQVMAFNREMQRIHTTHTFASLNTVATGGTGADIFDAPMPATGSYRDKNVAGASSKGMDAFLDTLAKQQRRESQSARGQASSNGGGVVTRFGAASASTRQAKLAASTHLLAMNGIDVSGQMTTVRNVHTIKKELDDKHQPVAPWFMRPDARIRKRTGALYYLNGGGGGGGGEGPKSPDGERDPNNASNSGDGENGNSAATSPRLLQSNPAAAAPMAARFTLTNWSPLVQRYMLLLGGKNSATPESMAWTLTSNNQ